MTNAQVAEHLRIEANKREHRHADPHRVEAWRRAAVEVERYPEPMVVLCRERRLFSVPYVGEKIGSYIAHLLNPGHFG